MAKVEIISSNSNAPVEMVEEAIAPLPISDPTPATISFPLEGEPGEAIFNIPKVKHLKLAERGNPSPADLCRKLGEICLVSWGDRPSIPPDEEIDAVDDQQMMQLFLEQIDSAEGGEYEVLDDKSHKVQLNAGAIVFRRLNRKDVRLVENSKQGRVATELLLATAVCVEWWNKGRSIMPADFENLTLEEYGRVSKALQGFLAKRSTP